MDKCATMKIIGVDNRNNSAKIEGRSGSVNVGRPDDKKGSSERDEENFETKKNERRKRGREKVEGLV